MNNLQWCIYIYIYKIKYIILYFFILIYLLAQAIKCSIEIKINTCKLEHDAKE